MTNRVPGRRGPRMIVLSGILAVAALITPLGALADGPANTIYGYEAGLFSSRVLEYNVDQETEAVTFRRQCVPEPGVVNGRGIAFDKTSGGGGSQQWRLYLTKLTVFQGDGLIHVTGTPETGCQHIRDIPFEEGPGPPTQDGIGALDFDQGGGILYAAGYLAVNPVTNYPDTPFVGGTHQVLYRVRSSNGEILGRCQHPTQSFAASGGNDTLTVGKLTMGNQTRKVLWTDFGEFRPLTGAGLLYAIDPASLLDVGPPAPPCTVLATVVAGTNMGNFVAGFDYEMMPQPPAIPGPQHQHVFVGTTLGGFWDLSDPPSPVGRAIGTTLPSGEIEDISVERLPPGRLGMSSTALTNDVLSVSGP